MALPEDRTAEVVCPGCGSSFRLQEPPLGSTTAEGHPLGRFQVLGQVGTGAFGTVWRARDPGLDRLVALKLLHPSLVGSVADRERFFREARAAAQLRHPGIVTVHEVTTLEGVPAIVSDFVDGLTLREFLAARRLTFREAAELAAQVAEALDYAHQMGLVHRDVKPANIMIEIRPGRDAAAADTVARPLLLDFGLALRGEVEVTLTVDGQIVGTPAYMSPEQAAGHGHRVDRRSDVYSLGVVLYEFLAGELPFRGSKGMLRFQVLHEEPRPPRRINDKIPRDLETICLKAMAKEPARRYATARDLADDLRRFLQGEPVRARRVGPVGRLARWARRRPAVAALLLALAVLSVGGSGVLIYYRLDAAAARIAAANATAQQAQLEKQQAQERERLAQEALEKVEDTLAENLLRSVGYDSGPLTPAELAAFHELAASPSERVRLRFLEKALERPGTAARLTRRSEITGQLTRRSEIAAHAVVGLDRQRKDQALDLLLRRLRDERAEPEVLRACVLLGAVLQPRDEPFCRDATKVALVLMATNTDSSDLAQAVGTLAAQLPPQEAAAVAQKLVEAMARTADANTVAALGTAVGALAAGLPPEEAARVCAAAVQKLVEDMPKASNPNVLISLAQAVGMLADRLPPQEAAAAAQKLLEAMARQTSAVPALGEAVAALADRLPPQEATKMCVAAAHRLVEAIPSLDRDTLAQALIVLADRLPPEEAAAVAQKLVEVMAGLAVPDALESCARAVRTLVARLPPKEAAAVAQKLVEARPWTPYALPAFAQVAGALADRLPPQDADKLFQAAARKVVQAAASSFGAPNLPVRAVMAALAERLPPQEAAAAAQEVMEAIARTTYPGQLSALAQALAALAVRVPPEQAGKLCAAAAQKVVQAMAAPADSYNLAVLGQALAALAARLPPEQAGKLCAAAAQKVVQAMAPADSNLVLLGQLGQAAGALAAWLPPQEAGRVSAAAVQRLLQVLAKPGYAVSYDVVGTLAAHLPPHEAAAAAQKLLEAIPRTTDYGVLAALASALGKLADRLPREEAAILCAAAAHKLVEDMAKLDNDRMVAAQAHGVCELTARLPPAEADRLCLATAENLVEAMARTDNSYFVAYQTQAARELAERLPPAEAEKVRAAAGARLLNFAATDRLGLTAPERARTLTALLSRLTSQGLVDLLKQATCVGKNQRSTLDQLGPRVGPPAPEATPLAACTITAPQPRPLSAAVLLAHGEALHPGGRQPFADLWEAVDWISEHHPELDLDSPLQSAGR
jgi:tRNA A-37 threonylcarbamoyl transferase component Bud32